MREGDDGRRTRRDFIRTAVRTAANGATLSVLGGLYAFSDDARAANAGELRADGRPRLPGGQRLLTRLKPMGGRAGDPSKSKWRLRVHGEVERPFEISFRDLLAMPQVDQALDVHCVTGWSVLGAPWRGVKISTLADRAGLKRTARHVVFEAHGDYTANVRVADALSPSSMVAHRLDGSSLTSANGSPVRSLVPDLYFWKSAKWLTGIRFVRRDEPGYWETRGYHNHADPWLEERYSA